MFIDAFRLNEKATPSPEKPQNEKKSNNNDTTFNSETKRTKLRFASLNLGGPQYADKSEALIDHLGKLVQLNTETDQVFFFQEATKKHFKDLLNSFFQDQLININIKKDEGEDLGKDRNGHAIVEGHKNWYIVAPDYKKMTPIETKLIDSLTGLANFISGKNMKQYSEKDKKTGHSYLVTIIPKHFAESISDLKIRRNNSQKFMETQVTHFLHHLGKPAMGWGDRRNYVLQVNTPKLDTANIHLSAIESPYRRFLEILSTALMLKNPERRIPETRTEIIFDLDQAAKNTYLNKNKQKEPRTQIIAGDANFFKSAMGDETKLFSQIIKPLLEKIFGINTDYPTGHTSFKPTAGQAIHGNEELDITLSTSDLNFTEIHEMPKELTDHDLLQSEVLI